MICTNKGQAERVALAGAFKMDAAGYTFEKVAENLYEVSAPFLIKPYLVQTDPMIIEMMGGGFCSCEFAKLNPTFGTCKHYEWMLKNEAEEVHFAEHEIAFTDWCDERYYHDAQIAYREMAAA